VLDLKLFRENPIFIKEQLSRRGINIKTSELQDLSKKIKLLESERSLLQEESNKIGKEVGIKIKNGINPNSLEIAEFKKKGNLLKKEIAIKEEETKTLSNDLKKELQKLPNIPSSFTPEGLDESNNKEIMRWGDTFTSSDLFEHWQIADKLNLFESAKSTKIAKSRFVTLTGQGAKLERSLINFMLDTHSQNGYLEMLPPALVNSQSLFSSGQLPKFANESFQCSGDDLWLSPTAEVPITSFHRDEIIDSESLPLKYVAFSPCFRREAGSYGKDTKGLIRLHQFNKVELYWISHPEKSKQALESLTIDAESILKALELPYRKIELCSGDLGFSASRTFDLEVWLPGSNTFREISSCSNCTDFQARRSSIRTKINKKNILVHTLNGSGLAIGRTMAAILENGQQRDGRIKLPKVLIPYFGSEYLSQQNH
tara:strand:+ start:8871 stop:10154 length:1284 start_codon:yes stop_codon:yes gene_type:complete